MSLFTQLTNFLGFGDGLTQSQIDDGLYVYEGGEGDSDYIYDDYEETISRGVDGRNQGDFYSYDQANPWTPLTGEALDDQRSASFMGYKLPASFKKLKGVIDDKSNPLGQQRRRTTKRASPRTERPSRISDPRGESSAQRQLRLVGNTKGALARIDSEALLLNKIVEKLADSHYSKTTPAGETITLASSKSLRGQIAPKSRIT